MGACDALFFQLEKPREVPFLRYLDVRLALTLGVLETAVEEKDARLLDPSAHFRVRHVLFATNESQDTE